VRRALPYLLFGAISLACFWRFLFLGWTLYDVRTLEGHLGVRQPEAPGWFAAHRPPADRGDTILLLPMLHRIYTDGLHHGELRLWNPYLFCGYPLYNDPQVHPFYPPNLFLHSLLPYRLAYDLNLFLHFFFSGAAMFWLLRGSGRSEAAATLGGVLWMLLGYNAHWISTGILMGASVFAPLALLGLQRGLARRDFTSLALGGLSLGLVILGSHGQHALHLMIFFSLWMLVSWIRVGEARSFLLKGGALYLGAALGVGAAAILTQLDSVMNGLRVPGDDLQLHYASPWSQPLYIAGVALGKVCIPPGGLLRSEFTIYAGVVGTLLAAAGAARGFRDPWIRFVTIVAGAILLVAFVKPLAEFMLLVPFLNLGMPARWLYVFGFALALLAAAGVDALREEPAKSLRALVIGGAVCLLVLAVQYKRGAWVESLIGLALAAAWILTSRSAPRLGMAFCFAAILCDLLPNFVLFNRHADPAPLATPVPALETLASGDPWRATGSLRSAGGPPPADGWIFSIGNNILALHGVEAVMGYEAIAPQSAVDFCLAINGGKGVMGSGRVLAVINPDSRLLDLANLKYFFMPWPYDPGPRFRKLGEWGPLTVYENSAALPRAYLASSAAIAATEKDAYAALLSEGFDPRTTVVLQQDQFPSEPPRVSLGGGSVAWKSRGADRFELQVEAKADSILVVSDTDYPGWEAELDGRATPIRRANLAFRAVAVPAGTHRVTMRFRPRSARNGIILSGFSAIAILAFCGRRKRSPSQGPLDILKA
jgi:hypothetical protein